MRRLELRTVDREPSKRCGAGSAAKIAEFFHASTRKYQDITGDSLEISMASVQSVIQTTEVGT